MPKIWNLHSKIIFQAGLNAKLKYVQKYLKKGVKYLVLGQWGKKNKKICRMFSLAANQSSRLSKQRKIVYKS